MGNAWSNNGPATQVIIDGLEGQILVYNGTPAAGNLIYSVSSVLGTDAFGNTFFPGTTIYPTAPNGVAYTIGIDPLDPTKIPARIDLSSAFLGGPKLEIKGPPGTNGGILLNGGGSTSAIMFVNADIVFNTFCQGRYSSYEEAYSGLAVASGLGFTQVANLTPNAAASDYGTEWNLATGVYTAPADGYYEAFHTTHLSAGTGVLAAIERDPGTGTFASLAINDSTARGIVTTSASRFRMDKGWRLRFRVSNTSGAAANLDGTIGVGRNL